MKILLEAPILTNSGYGETSRFVYSCVKQKDNAQVDIIPLRWGNTSQNIFRKNPIVKEDIARCKAKFEKLTAEKKDQITLEDLNYDLHIFVGLPSEFEKKAPYCICVTAGIETDRVDHSWLIKTYQGIDKLIVPSQHAADGFNKTTYEVTNQTNNTKAVLGCNCPVEIVPYPVKEIEQENFPLSLSTGFNFLNISMSGPRKDLSNSIKYFIEEFREEEDVGLILKTSRSRSSIMDRDATYKSYKQLVDSFGPKKCKVYLLHGNLSESEIHSIYHHPSVKAYYTTTHGEGYGLPIFEAAYSGLPVIATDWSGHLDFLSAETKNKKNGKQKTKKLFAKIDYSIETVPSEVVWKGIITEDSRWAVVSSVSAKRQLRNVYQNYGMYNNWAKTLKDSILENFSYENVKNKMMDSIFSNNQEPSSAHNPEEMNITKL